MTANCLVVKLMAVSAWDNDDDTVPL